MPLEGFVRRVEALELLSREQLEDINSGALHILETTGVAIHHAGMAATLEGSGCAVDHDTKRVRFPRHLVQESLTKCPSSFRMRARNRANDLVLGGRSVHFGTFPGMDSVDLSTWERVRVSREEYYQGVTVLDALENLHFLSAYCPYFGYAGLPAVMAIPEGVAAQLRNSSKCLLSGSTDDSELFTIKMAEAVGADIMGSCHCASPLTFYAPAIESAYRFARSGNPIQVISGPLIGSTAPATMAGALAMNAAELMAGLTIVQLVKPGSRVMATNFVMQQDMRNGLPAFGAIGNALYQAAFNQFWRHWGVPTKSSTTGVSSSKKIDFQLGCEKSLITLVAALSGGNLIYLHGGVYGELTFHPVQAILDDDLAGMIGRFLGNVEVSSETLALDLIDTVGPIPGHYLDTDHTYSWWKREQFIPKSADGLSYASWETQGKKDCVDKARERMANILAEHQAVPLSREQDRSIEEILREARSYYAQQGKL